MPNAAKILAVFLLAAVSGVPATAQSSAALTRQLDSIAGAEVRANRAVGVAAAVYRGADKLLLAGYGQADLEGNLPIDANTITAIGSVTKQLTAVAILQLRDQGKLGLDDEVTKWLPELNTGGNHITLRHLLNHTAGFVELGEMRELRDAQMMRNPTLTRDSVYRIISRYAPIFPPGTMEIYSNTNFWLLGRIIEKASGMRYEDYIGQKLLTPLRMSRSMPCDKAKEVPNHASPYMMRNGAKVRAPDVVHTATYAAGAICSTVTDMIAWLQALHSGKLLSQQSYTELVTPAKLNDGTPVRYALGTTVADDSHGLRYIGHNGGGFGFSSEVRWYPDAKLAIVVLTNSEPDAITVTTENIAAAVLPAPRVTATQFTGDPAPLAGKYKGISGSGDMIIAVTNDARGLLFSIQGQPAETLPWVEGRTFRKRDELLSFRGNANEPASELHFDTGGDHFVLKRAASTSVAMTAPLTAFEGTYEGQAPGTTVRIAIENDTLRVLPSAGGKANLIPAGGTTFYNGREGAPRTITFNLGADGKAESATLKGPGAERTLKRLP